jgi:Zn finger protein HypA/HybF involved in hydrogenase expression
MNGKFDLKLVVNCKNCNSRLPKFNKHHFLCDKCWKEKFSPEGLLGVKV